MTSAPKAIAAATKEVSRSLASAAESGGAALRNEESAAVDATRATHATVTPTGVATSEEEVEADVSAVSTASGLDSDSSDGESMSVDGAVGCSEAQTISPVRNALGAKPALAKTDTSTTPGQEPSSSAPTIQTAGLTKTGPPKAKAALPSSRVRHSDWSQQLRCWWRCLDSREVIRAVRSERRKGRMPEAPVASRGLAVLTIQEVESALFRRYGKGPGASSSRSRRRRAQRYHARRAQHWRKKQTRSASPARVKRARGPSNASTASSDASNGWTRVDSSASTAATVDTLRAMRAKTSSITALVRNFATRSTRRIAARVNRACRQGLT